MKILDLNEIMDLAAKFWIQTGHSPTHILMTVEQQKSLSTTLVPRECITSNHISAEDSNLTTIQVNPTTILDVLAVAPLRCGRTNPIEYPKVIRIEE